MINMVENPQEKIEMKQQIGYFRRCMDTFMDVYNRNLRGKKYNQTHTHTHTHSHTH